MNPPIYASQPSEEESGSGGFMSAAMSALAGDWVSAATGLLGGLFGKKQTEKRNRMQMQLAREQMRFQERMSNTQYQRATKDLEAAGLNRILALGKPASSPAGAMAQLNDPGVTAINSALAVRRQTQELRNLRAQERLTDRQAIREKATAEQIQSQSGLQQAQTQEAVERIMTIAAERPGRIAESKIRQLQIQGVRTEEEFFRWLNDDGPEGAGTYFKGLTSMGPLILQFMRLFVSMNRNTNR